MLIVADIIHTCLEKIFMILLYFFLGPEEWHKNYPFAKGRHQSPIEINNTEVHYDSSLLPWFASYDPGSAKTILNNGKTCRVVFDDSFDRSGRFCFHLSLSSYISDCFSICVEEPALTVQAVRRSLCTACV